MRESRTYGSVRGVLREKHPYRDSEVGERMFEYVRRVASGEIQSKAEIVKHREFQVWAEQVVSL
jgi:altronate dehydratase